MAEIDTSIYKGAMPQDPLDQAGKVMGLANSAQQLDTSKFDLAMKHLGALQSVTSSFLSDPEAGKKDMTKKIQDEGTKLVALGIFSPQQIVTAMKAFPKDPSEQYKYMIRMHAQTLHATELANSVFGLNADLNTGPGTLTRQTPQYPGLPVRERGYVSHGLLPTTTVPNATTQQPEYLGTGEPPAVQPRPGSIRPVPQPMPSPVRPSPVAPGPAGGPDVAIPPSQRAGGPSPRVPAAFPLGTDTTATGSAAGLVAAREDAGTYQERVNPVRNAIEIVAKMDPKAIGQMGPGSDQFNKLKSAAITWGLGEIAGIDPQKVADFNKLKKYLEDATARRASAFGPKTNDGLASAVASSPNVKLGKLEVADLLRVNLGLDRMRQAMALDFDSVQPPIPPGQFGTWKAKWATNHDPRAFVYDLMTPAAQQKLTKSLTPVQRKKFEDSLRLADKHDLLGDVRD